VRSWSEAVNSMAIARMQSTGNSLASRLGFLFTLFYLIFEYGRPQDYVSQLAAVRPGLVLSATLVVLLLVNLPRITRAASPQTWHVLLFLFLMMLHVPFAQNTGRAYFTTEGFLLNVIVFISIVTFVDTIDRLRNLLTCWVLLMIFIAINGILGSGAAGSSFLQDENDFAHLMNVMLPFGVFLFFYARSKKGKLFYLAASLLCVASIVASFSRGGFIGLLLIALAIWLASSRKFLMLGAGTVMAVIILNLPITHSGTLVAGSTYWEEMTTIVQQEDKDFNKDSRMEYWKSAWEMFKDHPLGVGPQNFGVMLGDYETEYFSQLGRSPENMWGKVAHSLWFTLLPELGIPGLLLYLSLLLANVRDIIHLKRQGPQKSDLHRFVHFLSLAYLTGVVGYLVSGTFVSVLYYPHYWYLTAMIVATRKIFDCALAPEVKVSSGKVEEFPAT
jgi:O-antigen ligase